MNPSLRKDYLPGLFGLEKASYYVFDNFELLKFKILQSATAN